MTHHRPSPSAITTSTVHCNSNIIEDDLERFSAPSPSQSSSTVIFAKIDDSLAAAPIAHTDRLRYQAALERCGFTVVHPSATIVDDSINRDATNDASTDAAAPVCTLVYRWNAASGMLQFIQSLSSNVDVDNAKFTPPKWIPLHQDKETVLISNGWSFLDADESEPHASFDIEAANREGLYRPQWGDTNTAGVAAISELGYDLQRLTRDEVLAAADTLMSDLSRRVLLEGATDPPHVKQTHNGVDFGNNSELLSNLASTTSSGIFTCAVSGIPLFASTDLALAATVASGWLSFARPVSLQHIQLVRPKSSDCVDQRIEVVCAKSGCHLGHYFGQEDGYCINASVLNFLEPKSVPEPPAFVGKRAPANRVDGAARVVTTRATTSSAMTVPEIAFPVSYRALEMSESQAPSVQILRHVVRSHMVPTEFVALGAGCFWHVEAALRRLPGVISTCVGYAGGITVSPTYAQVCGGSGDEYASTSDSTSLVESTQHAEAVLVEFDPNVLLPRVLLDCFLAMHNPTQVVAHGRRDAQTGQYRSCIFLPATSSWEGVAQDALADCRNQLQQELATQLRRMPHDSTWFWEAEEWHQRHDEKRDGSITDLSTLPLSSWLQIYGQRSEPISGSAETIAVGIEQARFMI